MEPTGTIYNADARGICKFIDTPIHLTVTSPPYFSIKDYGVDGQIGYGQEYTDFMASLLDVLYRCAFLTVPGGRICVNIGEQYLSTKDHGRHRIAPTPQSIVEAMHSEYGVGDMDYMGSIIWNKVSTQNASGGGKWMGSTYWPTDIALAFEHEYILVFRKHGKRERPSDEVMEKSILTKEERGEWCRALWRIAPAKQKDHPATFPVELPNRLIKMFSYYGDTVLDPFLGSGTTMEAALSLGRNCIGVELSEEYASLAASRVGGRMFSGSVESVKIPTKEEIAEISEDTIENNLETYKALKEV